MKCYAALCDRLLPSLSVEGDQWLAQYGEPKAATNRTAQGMARSRNTLWRGFWRVLTVLQFPGAMFSFSVTLLAMSLWVRSTLAEEPPVIPAIAEAMNRFVQERAIVGGVTLVADRDHLLHQHVTGLADLADQRPMQADSIFWIASMSKPVTAACVLMLQDEGKLQLKDPITQHLPHMEQLRLSDGQPATITIEQLLTHTSGMSELPANQAYAPANLALVAEQYAKLPLLFPPGSRWQYSQTSINTAARIVEVVSGMSFDEFVARRLCEPLGMRDTGFYLSEDQLPRLATSYRKNDSGDWQVAPISVLNGKAPTSRDRFPAANGGLFSTAGDYVKFCQMLLNDGEFAGKRLLSTAAVGAMKTIATGDLQTGFTPGNGWGIGCCVVREPQGVTSSLSPGTFGHGGAYGTQAWIDPADNRIYLLMIQRADLPNSDASPMRQALQAGGQP